MNFIKGTSCDQTYFATLDDQVAPDNAARLIDAFVDKLQLQKLNAAAGVFTGSIEAKEASNQLPI